MEIKVDSSYSAQPSIAKPNPFIIKAIEHIINRELLALNDKDAKVADQGCGKLRHFNILCQYFNTIYFVDTESQLSRHQTLFGLKTNIRECINNLKINGKSLSVLSDVDFTCSNLNLDIIFDLCVFDVVLPEIRKAIIFSAHKNLRKDGLFVVIIPRNDQSILDRCKPENKYFDGFIFQHHGVATFYRNFKDFSEILNPILTQGFSLEADLSAYRQICLILRKVG